MLWSALPRELRRLTRPVCCPRLLGQNALAALSGQFIQRAANRSQRDQSPPEPSGFHAERDRQYLFAHRVSRGSRAEDGEMGQFKSGLYYLAKKRPDLELVPVYMDNMNRILPRGEFLPVPLLSSITIGAPIWLESGEQKSDFLNRARESVRALKDR